MRIGGLQKTTALDYPGMVSAVVFTQGCSFLCPYCHNPELVLHSGEMLEEPSVLGFLAGRKRLLDGVVISGGEPTLQPDLMAFCATVKSMGFAVKLDTNGSRPQVLRQLLSLQLLDYVALDIKADPHNYPKVISPAPLGDAILESIECVAASGLPHEFRTTCIAPFVTQKTIAAIAKATAKTGPLFLQQARLGSVLDARYFTELGVQAPTRQDLEALQHIAKQYGSDCRIR